MRGGQKISRSDYLFDLKYLNASHFKGGQVQAFVGSLLDFYCVGQHQKKIQKKDGRLGHCYI